MDLNAFLRERRPRWDRLAQLLQRISSRGLADLSHAEVTEFYSLYRLVSSDLNLAQTRTANPALIDYLETLVSQAYANLAVPRESRFFRSWWQVLRHYFPAALRDNRGCLALSAAAMLLGTLLGFGLTMADPRAGELFLPPEHLAQRPRDRVAQLESMTQSGQNSISTFGQHSLFSTFLFTHNIRVSVLAFGLGLTFGVGTIVVLFFNGAMLGSLAALYLDDGVMTFFIAWVGPHGAIELPCILFAGTAGLMLARAQLRHHRALSEQIRQLRPTLVDLLVGTATLLVLAGLIEGGFSQLTEPAISYEFKIAVAAALAAALASYLVLLPARRRDFSVT